MDNMTQLYTALLLVASINNIALLYILLRRPERSAVVILFALFLIAITSWGVPQFIINWNKAGIGLYSYLDRFSALGYVTLPAIFFTFSLAFTRKLHVLKNILLSAYVFVPGIVFLFLSWSTNLIDNHSPEAIVVNRWGYNSPPGIYFPYFLGWLESLMIASIGVLAFFYRSTSHALQRRQAIMLIVAILIPLVFGTITDGILPIFNIHIFPSAVPLTTIMAIIIGYAIMRYELFNFEPQTILSSLGDGLLTLNTKGRIISSNDVAEKLIGKSESELHHKKLYGILEHEKNHDDQKIERYIKEGKKLSSSEYVLVSNHKRLPVSVTLTPIELDKKIVGATLLIKDIKDEKKREESKDEFISIASHELKTPITSIKLYSDILGKKISQNSKEYTLVANLQEQVNRMVLLTNDLLDLSRIRTGSMHLHLELFDLPELITTIVATIRKTDPDRIIIVKGKVDKKVYADKNRIAQVVTNLISNAVKYSPQSTKVIVTLKLQDSNVMVKVKDYGQGIPAAQQNKIFNRFYRVDGAMTDQPSLGIGLYISSNIIKHHKGKIWVESAPSKGSTFIFTIPLGRQQNPKQ